MTIGWTENYSNGHIELYGVRTDAAGQIPGCNQVNTTDNSGTMNPQITALSSTLPIDSTITPGTRVSITKQRTSVAIRPKCRTD